MADTIEAPVQGRLSPLVDELAAILPAIAKAIAAHVQVGQEAAAAGLERQAKAYEAARLAAELRVAKVASLTSGAVVEKDLDTVRTTMLAPADTAAKAAPPDYYGGMDLLEGVDGACVAAEAVVARHDLYLIALDGAEKDLMTLSDPLITKDAEAISTECIAAAASAAASRNYDAAMDLLAQVAERCKTARDVVANDAISGEEIVAAKLLVAGLTETLIADDRKTIEDTMIAPAEEARTGRKFDLVTRLLAPVAGACEAARKVVLDDQACGREIEAAKLLVAALIDPVIATDRKTIEDTMIAPAETARTRREFTTASDHLGKVASACAAAQIIVTRHGVYQQALTAAQDALKELTAPVILPDKSKIEEELVEPAKVLAAPPGRKYEEAGNKLALVDGRCKTALAIAEKDRIYQAALKKVEDRVNLLTAPVIAPEIVIVNTTCVAKAKEQAAPGLRNYDGAMPFLTQAEKLCDIADLHARRYAAGLAVAEQEFNRVNTRAAGEISNTDWTNWGAPTMVGVTDVLPTIKLECLDAAKNFAAAGNYAAAMPPLENVAGRLAPVRAAIDAFVDFFNTMEPLYGANDAAVNAAPTTELADAYNRLKTRIFDPAVQKAVTGDFAGATTDITPWGPERLKIEAVAAKWQPAVDAHDTLTLGSINTDQNRIWNDCIHEAADKISSDDFAGAIVLLDKAIAQCPLILAYGQAMDAAVSALASATVYDDDRDRLQRDYIEAAEALATAWQYPAAAALAGKAIEAITQAATLYTTRESKNTACDQTKLLAGSVATAPDPAVEGAKVLFEVLKLSEFASDFATAIAAGEKFIADAEGFIKAGEPDKAKTALEQACDKAKSVSRQMAEEVCFKDARVALENRINGLPAEAAPEKATIKTDYLDEAIAKRNNGDYAAANQLAAQGQAECGKAEEVARLCVLYNAAKSAADTAVGLLPTGFLDPDIAEIKTTMIDAAATEASNRDFQAALDLLKPVAEACATATKIKAEHTTYETDLAEIRNSWEQGEIWHNDAVSSGLTRRTDLDTTHGDIETNTIDAAAAEVTTRGLGEPALEAMKRAVKLLKDGLPKAQAYWDEAADYYESATERTKAQDALNLLDADPGKAAVAKEIADLKALMANAAILNTAGQSTAAVQVYTEVGWACTEASRIKGQAVAYANDLKAAKERVVLCKSKVDGLTTPSDGISAALKAVQDEVIGPAEAAAASRGYPEAQKLLATVAARCDAVEVLVTGHANYLLALDAAEKEVAKLVDPAIAAEVTRITLRFIDPAKKDAAALAYPPALAALAKVAAECAAAAKIAAGASEAANDRQLAGPALLAAGTDLPTAVDAVQKMLDKLLLHGEAPEITDLTGAIATLIGNAGNGQGDPTVLLSDAADRCVAARTVADRYAAFTAARTAANLAADGLTSPIVSTDQTRVRDEIIKGATDLVVPEKRDFAAAMVLLDKAQAECSAATAIAAAEVIFQDNLAKAKLALNNLAAITPPDPVIGVGALAVKTELIDKAETMAALPERKHAEAEKLLAQVAARCKALALQKKMAADTPPTESEITDMLALPGGEALVDEMIGKLPDDCARGVLEVAIKARFGLDSFKNFESTGAVKDATAKKGAKSLKKIYALLALVPDSHTKDNPSLKDVERYGGGSSLPENVKRGSYFAPGGKVVLSCGRAKDTDLQPLARSPLQLPNVEPDCEMVPDSEVPAPKYFDWTTLHEVGHAIDDKKRFMAGKAGDSAFGGWQSHGRDVVPVAKAIAKQTRFNGAKGESYIIAYLLGGKPPIPAEPTRVDWDTCRQAAEAWCDEIRVDKKMWGNNGAATAHAVDGRVYHEAYAGSWVSYDLAARTKGITGYQFRAPGEWLSELYAAWHSEKLKPTHPAASWLETL